MNTDRELMQQALEALEQVAEYFNFDSTEAKTIIALRKRLVQPDPSAYWHNEFLKHNTTSEQPAQQQEPWEHLKAYGYAPGGYMMTCRGCNITVIDVDKRASRCKPCAIKALKAQQQEPVAWMHPDEYKTYFTTDPSEDLLLNDYWTPLYTSPPASKPWVGLSDDEIDDIAAHHGLDFMVYMPFARAIEAAHGIGEKPDAA